MARRRRNEEELSRNSGSIGYSQKALDALERGTYGKETGRTAQYRTSQEQTQAVKSIPMIEGMNPLAEVPSRNKSSIDTSRARAKYEQKIDHKPIGKALTEKDKAILYQGAIRMLNNNMTPEEATNDIMNGSSSGNAGMMQGYARNKDWQAEYGKSLQELIEEFANNESAMKRHTEDIAHSSGKVAKTLGSTYMNAVVKPYEGAKAAFNNLTSPESQKTKGTNKVARTHSDMSRTAREDVKKDMSGIGSTLYDLGTNVADRALPYLIPGGKAIGSVSTLFRTAEDKREELEDRGITGRKAEAQALASGGIDAALDLVGLEKIKGLKALKDSERLIPALAGSGIIGGAEQGITSVVNEAIDRIANGADSLFSVNRQNYINQGLSEDEADKQATIDEATAIAQETGEGALFGMLMGLGGNIVNKPKSKFPMLEGMMGNKNVAETTKSGKATSIKNPYNGVKPSQSISNEMRIDIPIDHLNDATNNIEKAVADGKAAGKSYRSFLTKIYNRLFDNRGEGVTSFDVPVKNVSFEDGNYVVTVNKRAIGKIISDKNVSPEKVAIIDHLEDIIGNGNYVDSGSYVPSGKKIKNVERYDYFETPIRIGDKDYIVSFDVEVLPGTNKYRTHKVINEINLSEVEGFSTDTSTLHAVSTPDEKGLFDSNVNPEEANVNRTMNESAGANNPKLTSEVTPPGDNGERIRSFSRRGSEDVSLPDEVRAALSEDMYKVVRNADTEARANELFNPDDLIQTRSNLDKALKSLDPVAPSLSYKLAHALIESGQYDAAVDVIEQASAGLTRGGQFTQAAKLAMMQNDPMAAMRAYTRDLENLNEWGKKKYKGKWKNLDLSKEDMDAFAQIQKGDSEALNNLTDQLNAKFSKQIPANWWDKTVGATKTAMLLNPRTQLRNVLANVATLPIRSASDRVSAVGQNITHLINPDMKVTQSITGGTKEQKNIAKQIFERDKESILGENKMKDSVKSDVLSQRQIFNDDFFAKWIDNLTNGGIQRLNEKFGANGNQSTMETLQNFTYWLMGDVGDTPFVKQNFVNRLASYMKAQGITKMEDVPDEAIAIATQEALKATFKDDNAFTKALQGVKQKSGKFGEVALPFVKTPANLTMRAIDYSPAGLINTFRKIKSGAEANAVIDEVSKNLTGTAMIYLGYKLAEKGLLSGSYSSDADEKAFQRQQGVLENAVHVPENVPVIGGGYVTYDWTQPAATPLVLGQTIYEAVQNSDKQNSDIMDIVDATYKGGLKVANTVINSSPLQSLSDLLGDSQYGDEGVAENIANEIIEFPQRFIPSVVGAVARSVDPTIRDTYVKDSTLSGTVGNQLRQYASKIPFLSKTLPASYDTWGNERTRSDSKGQAFFAQMVNPGQWGNNNSTPLDAEIQRIYDATGNKAVFPLNAARSLDLGSDGNITLTNKQHSDYQKTMGQRSYSYAESIMNNPDYQNLSDDEKASILEKAYKLSNDITKEEMFDHVTDNNKKLKEVARKGTPDDVAKYLLDSEKAKGLGMTMDQYQKAETEKPGGAEQKAAEKNTAQELGFVKKDGNVNFDGYEKAVEIFGNDTAAIQEYAEFSKRGLKKNAELVPALEEMSAFTDEQKGNIIMSAHNYKYDDLGATAKGAYDRDGAAGLYHFYLLKNIADNQYGDGNGSVKKSEKEALLNSDNPHVTSLPDDMYYYLAGAKW